MHYSSESTSVVPTPSLQVSHCPILLDCVHNLLWPTDSHFNTLNKRSNLWRISLPFGSIMSGTVTVWTKGPDFEWGIPGDNKPYLPKAEQLPRSCWVLQSWRQMYADFPLHLGKYETLIYITARGSSLSLEPLLISKALGLDNRCGLLSTKGSRSGIYVSDKSEVSQFPLHLENSCIAMWISSGWQYIPLILARTHRQNTSKKNMVSLHFPWYAGLRCELGVFHRPWIFHIYSLPFVTMLVIKCRIPPMWKFLLIYM